LLDCLSPIQSSYNNEIGMILAGAVVSAMAVRLAGASFASHLATTTKPITYQIWSGLGIGANPSHYPPW
jgi:hypothetical protein